MRHGPVAAGRVAEEAALDRVAQRRRRHGREGAVGDDGCLGAPAPARTRVCRNRSAVATGNFGAFEAGPPNPPYSRILAGGESVRGGDEVVGAAGSGDACGAGAASRTSARAPATASAVSSIWSRRSVHASCTAASTCRKAGMPARGCGREVGARVERPALGRREHRERPPEARRERGGRRHVRGVDLGVLLAVDLDRHEAGVELRGGRGVLERLARHHVAPVAGRVADRHHHGHVAAPRLGERLLAPREPRDRVARVGSQVRARCFREAWVHGIRSSRSRAVSSPRRGAR